MKHTTSSAVIRVFALMLCASLFSFSFSAPAVAKADVDTSELAAAYMESARFYHEQGRLRKAYRYFKKVYKKFPKDELAPQALMSMGKVDIERERYFDAYETFDDLLAEYPESANYADAVAEIFKIGNVYLGHQKRSGKYKASSMRKAVKIFNNLQTRTLDNEMSVRALYNCGIANYRLENFSSALDTLERIPSTQTTIKNDVCFLICCCYYELAVRGRNNQIPVNNALKMIPSYMDKIDSAEYLEDVAVMMAEVEELKAEHYEKIARYYEKTKHSSAAELYRNKIVSEFPGTQAAQNAKQKVN